MDSLTPQVKCKKGGATRNLPGAVRKFSCASLAKKVITQGKKILCTPCYKIDLRGYAAWDGGDITPFNLPLSMRMRLKVHMLDFYHNYHRAGILVGRISEEWRCYGHLFRDCHIRPYTPPTAPLIFSIFSNSKFALIEKRKSSILSAILCFLWRSRGL